ncbi:MAG TPA: hypothetical protein VEJ46_16455 [Candidatus Acidoferrum sp.]|nr:hypothetical protein [Candidatus Acidoferrum sp.]
MNAHIEIAARKVAPHFLRVFAAVLAALALAGFAVADTLELKTGQIIQGKFIGGSSMNIRFQVNGQEQVFATKDVLNIGFSDTGDASSAAPPPQAAPAPAAAPTVPAAPAAASDLPAAPTPQAAPSSARTASVPAAPTITIPAGTSVLVRMIDGIDSSHNQVGDIFHASLESAVVVGDTVVAPKGADAYGKLTQAKEAGKISGAAQLTLELTGIRIAGNIVPVDSTDYDVAGKGRGTQSAERIGGGAVLGTIIGAVAGGGKGAAIGAVAGAGTGTAVQVMTHGQQVRIPSETLLEFRLQQDVTARLSPAN